MVLTKKELEVLERLELSGYYPIHNNGKLEFMKIKEVSNDIDILRNLFERILKGE